MMSAQRSEPKPWSAPWTSWIRSLAALSVSVFVVATTSISLVRGLNTPVDIEPWMSTPVRFRPRALRQDWTARLRNELRPGPPALMTRTSMSIAR